MNDRVYWFLVKIINSLYWGGELILEGDLPGDQPAVFAANHIGPDGPIGAVCTIPLRLYPWIIADMIDPALAAEYLRIDFVEKSLHLRSPTSATVSKNLARITAPLLQNLGCIPVYREFSRLQSTLQVSLDLLLAGHHVLVFPEDETMPVIPEFNMTHFRKGVARLGEMYYQQTGRQLAFYPVSIHISRQVRVGKPIYYSTDNPLPLERIRIRDFLEESVHQLYLESTAKP